MRNTFVSTLLEMARENRDLVLITGDLGFGVLTEFAKELPNQFLNAGIAEQNMTGVATGLALTGKTVFTYSIANFPTLRCLEQIRNDAAYHGANVKVVSVGAGMAYGPSGISHYATEDIAVLRAIPDVAVFSPADPAETVAVTRALCSLPGTCYLRLGKGGERRIHAAPLRWTVGEAIPLFAEGDTALFATGAILDNAYEAACALNRLGRYTRLYSFPSIKPLDAELIRRVALTTSRIVTVEEHGLAGGFGSAVAEVLAEMPPPRAALRRLGLPDRFPETVGSQAFLRQALGLSADAIARAVLNEPDAQACPGIPGAGLGNGAPTPA